MARLVFTRRALDEFSSGSMPPLSMYYPALARPAAATTRLSMNLFIIPLTVIPLILYNIVGSIWANPWSLEIIGLTMISGARWSFTVGDLFIILGIVCLFFDVLKSTSSSSRTIINHILSIIVFTIYLIEFIVVGIATTSAFFILLAISLFDVVAGFTITIKTASRDIAFSRPVDSNT